MDNKLKKVLLVSAASFFETSITELLVKFFNIKAGNNPEIVAFLKNKAISRQYHSYFDWEKVISTSFSVFWGRIQKTGC